ncbi:MAG TPA: zinc-binding dehydrogenase [Novosphingobium sp.]|nr:zinc-binding dehydrogenase [Novosphingobium sp.]
MSVSDPTSNHMELPAEALELRSTVTSDRRLILSLESVTVPPPEAHEVVVAVEAAPLNPSDLGLLLGPADMSTMTVAGTADRPRVIAAIPESAMPSLSARIDRSMKVGNEGAGTVVAAGSAAGHLLGRKVGMFGGAMYAQLRTLPAADCVPLPERASAADGASMFVNPLTALAMVETMRAEGHRALVHTAAASNLGQMLNRICLNDGVPLVNIVRSESQAELLRSAGARHVVDSSAADFAEALEDAIAVTGATIAFDAVGGGRLAHAILHAMERSLSRTAAFSRYGSTTHKQVYIYGSLDRSPTALDRTYGMAWGIGGFLLTPFLQKLGPEGAARLRSRVAAELKTTFASHYTATVSFRELLDPVRLSAIARRATGEKYLIDPSLP